MSNECICLETQEVITMKILHLKPIAIFIVATVLFCSCEKTNTISFQGTGNLFPLQTGNLWQYDYVFNEVMGKTTIDGKEYFIVEEKLSGVMNTYYYRVDNQGNVYRKLIKDKPEGLYLKVNLNNGDSWQYKEYNDYENTPTIWNCIVRAKSTPVEYNGNVFENCYQVDFDVAEWVDEEHTVYFAPNIGKVKSHSYMWDIKTLLSRSIINGTETVYIEE